MVDIKNTSIRMLEKYLSDEKIANIFTGMNDYENNSHKTKMLTDKNTYTYDRLKDLQNNTFYSNILDDIQKKLFEKFGDNDIVPVMMLFTSYSGNEYHEVHIDFHENHTNCAQEELIEKYNYTQESLKTLELAKFRYSTLIYLNNNYDGGEIYFPQHNFEYKPEPGTLIMFSGDCHHLHGVKPVTNGIRYAILVFWMRTNEVPITH